MVRRKKGKGEGKRAKGGNATKRKKEKCTQKQVNKNVLVSHICILPSLQGAPGDIPGVTPFYGKVD